VEDQNKKGDVEVEEKNDVEWKQEGAGYLVMMVSITGR